MGECFRIAVQEVKMAKKIVIQRKGQTMKEGTIGRWLKKDGDYVKTGEPIYELEYDKATCEVESPVDGQIHIIMEEGVTLPVGTLVAEIYKEGEQIPDFDSVEKAGVISEEKESDQKAEPIQEYGISASAKRLIRQNGLEAEKIIPANGRRIMPEDVLKFMEEKAEEEKKVKATPLAKKIAEEAGVDLNKVVPTGIKERIIAEDIENYLKNSKRVPLSAMRKAIAKNMAQSYFNIPVVTYSMEIDFTEALKLRKEINLEYESRGVKISINDFILKAVAAALKKSPDMNVSLDGNEIVYHDEIHVGMAVSVPGGLVVPVIRNVDQKSFEEVAVDTKEMIQKASAGILTGDEMTGGTFTVSNLGSKGIDMFTPIINGNQSAILGVGRVQEKPVVINGAIEIRPMAVFSLTADHRLIDGSPAADFLGTIKKMIEKPILIFV